GGESATCDEDCTVAECGDSTTNVTAKEDCDDGGESATCDVDCSFAVCGDGQINMTAMETCDDMGESATCDDDCSAVSCGDNNVNITAGEQCDDGNNGNQDGCDSNCMVECKHPSVLHDLKITELHIGPEDYVRLENTNAFCSISLSNFELRFQDPYTQGVLVVLPDKLIAPNGSIYVAENAKMGDIQLNQNVNFARNFGGFVSLCTGPCDPNDGQWISDLLLFHGIFTPAPSLPAPATFANPTTLPNNFDENNLSFLRSKFDGMAPAFVGTDWTIGNKSY
ncbi:MAG: hypothetical protein VB934_16705, partial [Polyangiaceae bacterium]